MLNFRLFHTRKSADLAFFKLCPINEKQKAVTRFNVTFEKRVL